MRSTDRSPLVGYFLTPDGLQTQQHKLDLYFYPGTYKYSFHPIREGSSCR